MVKSSEIVDFRAYIETYLEETSRIAARISRPEIEAAIHELRALKARPGRLFIVGVGGSAGNASHSVNDFRKIGGLEAYAPTDNVSELTAWTNDASWDVVFREWLRESHLGGDDVLLVYSVGGGAPTVSQNLVVAMDYAKSRGARIVSIVSRDGGHAKDVSDVCILVPVVHPDRVTPHAEGWQAVVWHLLVNALGDE